MFRSTKGASKARRDLINNEISYLRDLIPLPESARQRLSQLQVMSLALCYIRKCNHFEKKFGCRPMSRPPVLDFTKAITGFLLVTTKDGKLLYLSENVTEYLGHSMVDLMTQGDSVYDIIHPRDHVDVRASLTSAACGDDFSFFCRMNVSRSLKRQGTYGDHKVMYVRGHLSEPAMLGEGQVFTALVTPLITPDVKEHMLHNCPGVFHSLHSLDMRFVEVSTSSTFHTGYEEHELLGNSWYGTIHPDDMLEAREKHAKLLQANHETGCMMTLRVLARDGSFFWVNCVLRLKVSLGSELGDRGIMCINQLIDESEVEHFRQQSSLYTSHIARSPEVLSQPSGDEYWNYSTQQLYGGYAESDLQASSPPHQGTHADWSAGRPLKRRATPSSDGSPNKSPRVSYSELSDEGIDSDLLLSALSQSLVALHHMDEHGDVMTSAVATQQLGAQFAQMKKSVDLRVMNPDTLLSTVPSPGPMTPDAVPCMSAGSSPGPRTPPSMISPDIMKNQQSYVIIPKSMLAPGVSVRSVEQCVPSVVSEYEESEGSASPAPPHPLPLLDPQTVEQFFQQQEEEEEDLLSRSLLDLLAAQEDGLGSPLSSIGDFVFSPTL